MASNSKKLAELSTQDNTNTDFIDLPGGTTAQRPSPAGSGNLRYNSTTGRAEYYNGNNQWQSIDTPPSVTSISPSGAAPNDTSASIVITGQNFQSGATASIVSSGGAVTNATTTTVDSATQVTAVFDTTGLAVGAYSLKVTNAGGLSGELTSGFAVSTSPSWTTSAGNISTFYSDVTGSVTLAATDAEGDSVSFALASGSSLYGGLSLNGSTGVISGDPSPDISAGGADVTNTFTVEATDGTTTVNRTFNIIIKEPLGTATNAATSAKQLYDAGYTSDGNYYINNVFTNNTAVQVYCKMGLDFGGQGTLYHVQKFLPSNLSNFAQYGNFTPSSATLSTISTTATDFGTMNYRYTTSNSSSGAAGVRQTGIPVSDLDSSGLFVLVDHVRNSGGDGNNPVGDGGPVWDTNLTGDVASNTNSHNYSNEWQNGYTNSQVSSDVNYVYGFLYGSTLTSGSYSAGDVTWYAGKGTTQTAAWNALFSSSKDTFTRSGSAYTVATTNVFGFKHQGWSDVGNSAQSDCIYWIGAEI